MKRVHDMPFGAQLLPGGGARFRLWAPGAGRVELLRPAAGRQAGRADAMPALGGGWFELRLDDAQPGRAMPTASTAAWSCPTRRRAATRTTCTAPSQLVDPAAFDWPDGGWRGRPWHEAVIYELHVGCFTRQGSFRAAIERLDDLVALGVTAIELMPVADFPGRRGWGYDGVLLFAPEAALRPPRRSEAARRRRARARTDGAARRRLQPLRPRRQLPARLCRRRLLRPGGAHAVGRGDQLRRAAARHGARLLHPQRAVLDRGVPPRRPAHRCRACDARPRRRCTSPTSWRSACAQAVGAIAARASGPGERCQRRGAPGARRRRPRAAGRRAMERRCAPRDARAGHRRDATATTPTMPMHRCATSGARWPRASRTRASPPPIGGGRARHAVGASAAAGLRQCAADARPDRQPRAGRAHRHARGGMPDARPRCARWWPACCCRRRRRCCSWARSGRAGTPFLYFCDFEGDLARAVTEGRRNEFGRFARFADAQARAAIPDPNAQDSFQRSRLDWRERRRAAACRMAGAVHAAAAAAPCRADAASGRGSAAAPGPSRRRARCSSAGRWAAGHRWHLLAQLADAAGPAALAAAAAGTCGLPHPRRRDAACRLGR